MSVTPITTANSEVLSQTPMNSDAAASSPAFSKEAEALLVGSALNMDFGRLRLVAIEHLLIHAEEAALSSCSVSINELNKWRVHERRVIMDNILSRNFDEALVGLATISPKAVDAVHSSGAAVALLCAKAREIAVNDEEAALRFLSEDVADSVAGIWKKGVYGLNDMHTMDQHSKMGEKGVGEIAGPDTAAGLGSSINDYYSTNMFTDGNNPKPPLTPHNGTHNCEIMREKDESFAVMGEYERSCGSAAKLVEKTLGEILFAKSSDASSVGPALGQNELETLAMAANAVALDILGLSSVSILTCVLDICTGKQPDPLESGTATTDSQQHSRFGAEEMGVSVRSQNHPTTPNGVSRNINEEDMLGTDNIGSWALKTLLGVRLIE